VRGSNGQLLTKDDAPRGQKETGSKRPYKRMAVPFGYGKLLTSIERLVAGR
jgi:hypothetical protein